MIQCVPILCMSYFGESTRWNEVLAPHSFTKEWYFGEVMNVERPQNGNALLKTCRWGYWAEVDCLLDKNALEKLRNWCLFVARLFGTGIEQNWHVAVWNPWFFSAGHKHSTRRMSTLIYIYIFKYKYTYIYIHPRSLSSLAPGKWWLEHKPFPFAYFQGRAVKLAGSSNSI